MSLDPTKKQNPQSKPVKPAPPAQPVGGGPANNLHDYLQNEFANATYGGDGKVSGGTRAAYHGMTPDEAWAHATSLWSGNHSAGHGADGGLTSGGLTSSGVGSAQASSGSQSQPASATRPGTPAPGGTNPAPGAGGGTPAPASIAPTGPQAGSDPFTNGTFQSAADRSAQMNATQLRPPSPTGAAAGDAAMKAQTQSDINAPLSAGQLAAAGGHVSFSKTNPEGTPGARIVDNGVNVTPSIDKDLRAQEPVAPQKLALGVSNPVSPVGNVAGLAAKPGEELAGQPGGFSISTGVAQQPDSNFGGVNISPTAKPATVAASNAPDNRSTQAKLADLPPASNSGPLNPSPTGAIADSPELDEYGNPKGPKGKGAPAFGLAVD